MSKNKQLEEEARKRRTSSVFSNTYGNGGWSKRDNLPSGDLIEDVGESNAILPIKNGVYDPYVESYKKRWQIPNNKNQKKHEPKCDCGTESTYGKVSLNMHANYCSLRG